MFVGHGLVAFALAAGLAHARGWSAERALAVGVLAGAFGMAPDVDVLYAPVGLLAPGPGGPVESFWTAGNVVHRGVTHSLPVGVLAALAAGAWTRGTLPARAVSGLLAVGLVAVAALTDGGLAPLVMTAFVLAVLGLATVGQRRDFPPEVVAAAALVGLLAHPFGDLFTGSPPALLYPFDVVIVADRVALHPDPTLHLLAAAGVELATGWLAALVALRVTGRRLRDAVPPRAGLGVAFGAAVVVLPPPTLEVSYQFVFAVLGAGLVLAVPLGREARRRLRREPWRPALAGLAAVTLGTVAYATAFVVAGPG